MNKYIDFFTDNKLQVDLNNIRDHTNKKLIKQIGGPLQDTNLKQVLITINNNFEDGRKHLLFTEYQKKYGKQQMSSNIHIPYLNKEGIVKDFIILCHPNDCKRITETHIKKAPTLELIC